MLHKRMDSHPLRIPKLTILTYFYLIQGKSGLIFIENPILEEFDVFLEWILLPQKMNNSFSKVDVEMDRPMSPTHFV